MFKLLQRNHVAALASMAVERMDVPREVKIPWLTEREKASGWYRYQREVQCDIIEKMSRNGIETLVLKGTRTAQYYPKEELREFGDLDLYFSRHREADDVARREFCVSIRTTSHHHTKYDYRGVTVESHFDFVNRHYPPSNHRYELMLKKISAQQSSFPSFEVLFLLRHMAGHFASSRITLRDLVDWYLTCRTLDDRVDWGDVQKTIKNYGMERFAKALCHIVERRFGYKIPLDFAIGRHDDEDESKVEHDIVYGDSVTVDKGLDGIDRLTWKFRRHHAMGWKRNMVFRDPALALFLSNITSHAERPYSILHKQ